MGPPPLGPARFDARLSERAAGFGPAAALLPVAAMRSRPLPRRHAVAPPRLAVFAAAAAALLSTGSSCSVNVGDDFDHAPRISLSVDPSRAAPGETVRLRASVSDDFGIERVRFFRSSASGSVALGSDLDAPFRLDTTLPGDASGTVEYFARVTDTDGQSRDSDRVEVEVAD